jgi:hypothetical protein
VSDVPVLRGARVTLQPVGEPGAEARLHLGRHPGILRACGVVAGDVRP